MPGREYFRLPVDGDIFGGPYAISGTSIPLNVVGADGMVDCPPTVKFCDVTDVDDGTAVNIVPFHRLL